MKPRETVRDLLACGPQTLDVVFHYLADRVYAAELTGGGMIRDISDCKMWLEELCEAARNPQPSQIGVFTPASARERFPFDAACPGCGHARAEANECGEKLGGGVCRCEHEAAGDP
jgi:hypothetical protein